MTNKKTELKRLLIFLFIAFAISWIPAIIFNKTLGYNDWFETNKYPVLFWIGGFICFKPIVISKGFIEDNCRYPAYGKCNK